MLDLTANIYVCKKHTNDKLLKSQRPAQILWTHKENSMENANWLLKCIFIENYNMHKLYITTTLGAWRWQLCKTGECKKSIKKIHLMDANVYEHFGGIRRCFQWRHSREESYTSRRRIIAQAQISSAFISPEVEVNIFQIWLIVTPLQRGGFTDPGHINVVLREIPCEDKFSFLNVKSRHIFHVWKARRTMVKGEIENGCSSSCVAAFIEIVLANAVNNVGRTLRRAV